MCKCVDFVCYRIVHMTTTTTTAACSAAPRFLGVFHSSFDINHMRTSNQNTCTAFGCLPMDFVPWISLYLCITGDVPWSFVIWNNDMKKSRSFWLSNRKYDSFVVYSVWLFVMWMAYGCFRLEFMNLIVSMRIYRWPHCLPYTHRVNWMDTVDEERRIVCMLLFYVLCSLVLARFDRKKKLENMRAAIEIFSCHR